MIKIALLFTLALLPACSWLNSSTASSTSTPTPVMSMDTTLQVQKQLTGHNLYHGKVDGIWGPATQAGVISYQQRNNLSPTGGMDGETFSSLNK